MAWVRDRVCPLMNRCRFKLVLLLPFLALVLGACLAGFSLQALAFQPDPAELRAVDLPMQAAREPLEHSPALTRGGTVMVAAESSRRKLRAPKRPQDQPPALANGLVAGVLERIHASPRPVSAPSVKPAQPNRPFLARGPPA